MDYAKQLALLTQEMIAYEANVPSRVQHFLKVHNFSRMIGLLENLDEHTLYILEAAALVHDIGIKPSIEKYGKGDGHYQEIEGPIAAEPMLLRLGFEKDIISRICYLIAHHHTYTNIEGIDYQILIEADFLVNLYEGSSDPETIQNVYDRIFKTTSGKSFCSSMFGIQERGVL